MKKILSLLPILLLYAISNFAQRPPCKAHELLEEAIQTDPAFAKERLLLEEKTQQYATSGRTVTGTITIPVVFHVIHNGDALGSGENIADTYLHAQLEQLNDDFRRLNSDKGNTPSDFTGVASDVEIEFCLATIDPDGNATTGIVRHQMTRASYTANRIDNTVKPSTMWNRDHYMNFYTVRFGGSDSETLGYAQFPSGPANTDAVVCGYQFVGSLATPNPAGNSYGYGRTATHEVGHWLNLYHIWGDGNCNVDDEVADTPNQGEANYNDTPCNYPGNNSCTDASNDLPDMFQNYMDYSDDECMNLFTAGQKTRMRALFDTGGARANLLNSQGCSVQECVVNSISIGTISCSGYNASFMVSADISNGSGNYRVYSGSSSIGNASGPANGTVNISVTIAGPYAPGTTTLSVRDASVTTCTKNTSVTLPSCNTANTCSTPINTISSNPSAGVHDASNMILTSGAVAVTNTVVFTAASSITMNAGFEVNAGQTFLAFIQPCSPLQQEELPINSFLGMNPSGQVSRHPNLSIRPNPSTNLTSFDFNMAENGSVSMEIYNLNGQLMDQVMQNKWMDQGKHSISYNAHKLDSGIFHLVLKTAGKIYTEKLVLVK